MNITDLPKIRVIVHKGERFGHQKASYTLIKRLRELGFKGQFEIVYDDLYPEPVVPPKYTAHIGDLLPGSNIEHMPQPIEMQYKIYLDKLSGFIKQLLPRYKSEYDRLDQILKSTSIDDAKKINHIDGILCQCLNTKKAELKLVQNAYDKAYTNLVDAFKREIIKEKDMELLPTEVRLSCHLPAREIVEASAQPKEKQLLDFVHTHSDYVSIQLVYGLKPLAPVTARPTTTSSNVGYIGRKLEVIFSGYLSPDITDESTRSESVNINHPLLGDLIITRLPSNNSEWHLEHIPLSFVAATDKLTPRDRPTTTYSTDICVVTQPTNWKAKSFIDISDQTKPILTEEQLCSFSYNSKQYCIDINDNTAIIAMCESPEFSCDSKLLQELKTFKAAQQKQDEQSYKYRDIALFENMRFYALRDRKFSQSKPINIKARYRNPLDQLKDLIAFYNANKSDMNRPYVLLVPNFEKVFSNMSNDEIIDILGNNVKIIKNTTDIQKSDDYIYVLCTGSLHPETFDYLTTFPNMLPAVIEGCNAVELCEYNGAPFLLVNPGGYVVQKLYSEDEDFNSIQNLHVNASLYLSNGKEDNKQAYISYMHLAISKSNVLEKYFQQRKEIYKNTRSDVIERSLQIITAVGIQTQSKVYESIKATSPTI